MTTHPAARPAARRPGRRPGPGPRLAVRRRATAATSAAAVALGLGLADAGASPASADGVRGTTARVSVDGRGQQVADGSRFPELTSLSASGRYATFVSVAPDLVAGDTNGEPDVFVRDRLAGTTTRVSVGPDGRQGREASTEGTISADGRTVVFVTADALVPQDRNRQPDLYARDLRAGTTRLVGRTPAGRAADGPTFFGSVSGDGRLVAFQSPAPDLVPGDANDREDVFVADLGTGRTTRVSVLPAGTGRVLAAFEPRLSQDGSTVLFATLGDRDRVTLWVRDLAAGTTQRVRTGIDARHVATSWGLSATGRYVGLATDQALVREDTNGTFDAYRLDRATGEVVLVSRSVTGTVSRHGSSVVALSADGARAVFTSSGGDLVPGDTNALEDVFLRDLVTGTTTRVSVASDGTQGDAESGYTQDVAISADGRHVAFVSFATTLVPDDTNGRPDVFVWDRLGDR